MFKALALGAALLGLAAPHHHRIWQPGMLTCDSTVNVTDQGRQVGPIIIGPCRWTPAHWQVSR